MTYPKFTKSRLKDALNSFIAFTYMERWNLDNIHTWDDLIEDGYWSTADRIKIKLYLKQLAFDDKLKGILYDSSN